MELDDVPVVPGETLTGHTHLFKSGDRLGFFLRVGETGEVSRTRFLKRRVLWINAPAGAHEVLVEKSRHFEKSPGIRLLLYYLAGEGLFTSEGELWRRQRKLMAPLFQPSSIGQYARCITDVTDRAMDSWRDGATVDLSREFTRITMGVVGKALFDSDTFSESDALGKALTTALQWADDQSASSRLVLQIAAVEALEKTRGHIPEALRHLHQRGEQALKEPLLLAGARGPELQQAIGILDRRIQAMIDERRAQDLGRNDLLTRLLAARDHDDAGFGGMTDRQVRDEVTTLFVAGHETTATALAWTFYLLGRNPAVRAAVQDEVDALPPGPVTFERAGTSLGLTTRAFKEAMRLYPPVTVYGRRALDETEIQGVRIRPRQLVLVNPYAIHHRPDVFPDPERFDPDRFLPEAEAARPKSSYIPFGAGPRVCIGMHFALLEGPIVLATLLRRARIETDPTKVIHGDLFATLRPRGGVPATVHLRA